MNVQELPGKPDIVFSEKRLAIFIDGCFWHGCPKCYRRPQSNQSYWDAKVAKNIQRDKANRVQLRRLGWTVLRFWEHDFKVSPNNAAERIRMKIG
jgi:DNA mismatch endonuclease, patch repair protein